MADELKVADQIELGNELLISGFLRNINRSSFDIAPLIYNLCILYRLGSAQHLWTVDQSTLQQMKNCQDGERVKSPTFEIEGMQWQLVICPNGYSEENEGSCDLFIKSVYMPSSWKHVEVTYRFQCLETMAEYVMYAELRKGQMCGWSRNSMLFSEIEPLNFLSFSINLTIQRIVLKEADRVLFERDNVATDQRVEWKIDGERLQILKTGHEGRCLCSNMYGGMYCLTLSRKENDIHLGLHALAMPRGKSELKLSWTARMIAKGDDFKKMWKMNKSSKKFKRGELARGVSGGHLPFSVEPRRMQFIMQCDSLILKVHIKCDSARDYKRDQLIIDYWTKMRMKQDGDERKVSGAKSKKIPSLHDRVDSMESTIKNLESAMITMAEDMAALNQTIMKLQADHVSDEYLCDEDTERMKFKKWMENKVKLPQYFELLIDNGFEDMYSVTNITMEHLREIGIDKMGHRLKLMKSIAALKAVDE